MSGDLTVANASNSIEVGVWSTVTTEECTWQPGSGSSTTSALASCPRGSANGIASSDAASAQRSGWFSRLTSWQEKWMTRKAEQVLAVSSPIALNAAGLGAAKVKAVHNEASADFFRVQISAYHSSKPTVKRVSPPNVEFVGSVPYIRLAGYHQRAEAGIVLYEEPRHRTVELSSMKLLEYMACGPPVFSTDVAGQELIRENQIGQFGRRETMSSEFGLFLKQLEGCKRYVDLHRQAIVQTRWRH